MDRPTVHRQAPRRRIAAGAGPIAVVGLACLVPLVVGCQTAAPWAEAQKARPGTSRTKADPALAKTEFHHDATPDQQYNMHLEMGHVFDAQQQHEAALAEYQKSLDACAHRGISGGVKGSGTRLATVHRRMGQSLDRLGRFAQAEVHYKAALKLSPEDPKVLNDAGYSFYLQSRWADAERTFKTAAKLAPDDVKIQTNLGLTMAAVGKTDEALVALSKAGGKAVGHANLAFLLAAKGQPDQARQHYQTALELQPQMSTARQALAALGPKKPLAEPIAAIPLPALPPGTSNVTDVAVRRTSGPRAIPLPVTYPAATH